VTIKGGCGEASFLNVNEKKKSSGSCCFSRQFVRHFCFEISLKMNVDCEATAQVRQPIGGGKRPILDIR